jgi:hypothetical protein
VVLVVVLVGLLHLILHGSSGDQVAELLPEMVIKIVGARDEVKKQVVAVTFPLLVNHHWDLVGPMLVA